MRIDLHTHSRMSDGTDSPAELVMNAAAAGLDVVALTDHDTAAGWASARQAAAALGLELVPGMEISTRLDGASVHLLAYYLDPDFPPLVIELERVLAGRGDRLAPMVAKLQELGIDITEDLVHSLSADATATGRPHVADAMIHLGVVASRDEAFERYLKPGRPAYVDRYAIDLRHGLEMVRRAGGVPVLAHPWGRGSRSHLSADTIAELADLGLLGIEVDHQDHDAAARAGLRAIAEDLGLIVTGSSDYHGVGKVNHDLGCNQTDDTQLARIKEAAGAG